MSHEPLPTPEQARDARLAGATDNIGRLREAARTAIAASTTARVWVPIPDGTGPIAYEAVKAELEGRRWFVSRESSEKNESFMVLTPQEGY